MGRIFILQLLVCSSCVNGIRCDLETKGLCVVFESPSIDEEDISKSIDILQEELGKYFTKVPKLHRLFENEDIVVKFVDYNLQIDCVRVERNMYECRDILGINYFGNDIIVEWMKCIGNSAFAHELLHTVENKMYKFMSSQHQGPLFNDNMNHPYESIEDKINLRIVNEVCNNKRK